MDEVGCEIWTLGLRQSTGELVSGCGAFLNRSRLCWNLVIPSMPLVGADSLFWDGLREFCRQQRVSELFIGTFGSPTGVEIPTFGDCTRRDRCEFVLDLKGDLMSMLGSNHKRNVKKAQKAGLVVRRTRTAAAAILHNRLMNQSLERRSSRGEDVHGVGPSPEHIAYLESGAGELFQAVHNTAVLSSVLLLISPNGGYYQSAGTSPEGMAIGASHFLINSIASQLSAENKEILNLGGADVDSGLGRFKEGFGASRLLLPEATFFLGVSWGRKFKRAIRLFSADRKVFLYLLFGQVSRFSIYAIDTEAVRPPEVQIGLTFQALSPDDLRSITVSDSSFRARQCSRLDRFGKSYAYGVYVDDQLAHISWLLPANAMQKDPPQVIKAQPDEAEITACETLPEFRGQGIYGMAIRNLILVARSQGVRRVLMKTKVEYKPSHRGIEKAGLERTGSAILFSFPLIHRTIIWRRFT
nr:GNAT family N-acetyltransferase [Bythopirellula goksoeyrii]